MTLWHIKTLEGDDLFALADSEEEAIERTGLEQSLVRDVVHLKAIYGLIWSEGYQVGYRDGQEPPF